jgi:hypothetical protein
MAPVGIPLPAHLCSNHSPSARLGISSVMAILLLGYRCSISVINGINIPGMNTHGFSLIEKIIFRDKGTIY